jgi:hypothetical protein
VKRVFWREWKRRTSALSRNHAMQPRMDTDEHR